jgi:hypothetical protein
VFAALGTILSLPRRPGNATMFTKEAVEPELIEYVDSIFLFPSINITLRHM